MHKPKSALIEKILAGDELTADEASELADMQVKKAERQAHREAMEKIKLKLDAGEELTQDEQAILESKEDSKGADKKGRGHGGNHVENRGESA